MKKGTKGNSLRHKTAPLTQSGFIASAVAFIGVAFVSLVTLGFNIGALCAFPSQKGDLIKDIGNIVVSAISFTASLIGACRSIKKLIHDSFNRQFLKDSEYEKKIKNFLLHNCDPLYKNSGYEWRKYDKACYLYSERVDDALSEAFPAKLNGNFQEPLPDLLLSVNPKIQPLSADQSEALYQLVKQKRAIGKNIFNSNLVRLRTDLLIDGVLSQTKKLNGDSSDKLKFTKIPMVEVEKTDYYSNMTSNDMIYLRLFKYDHSSVYDGKDMTVNGKVLYNLSESPAANIIGVTTLAITSDGMLVINRQDNNNDVNNDCYVPSGSGSADFDDLKECRKLEKKTMTLTYADELEKLCESYKSIKLNKNLKKYKKAVKNKLKNINATNTVSEHDLKYTLKPFKDIYENGINDRKEYIQLKKYCKKLKKYTCSFRNFITYGMVRELVEESHVCKTIKHKVDPFVMKKFMYKTEICGFIRIMDRGGKPDFFGITYLDYTSEQMKKMFLSLGLKVTEKELAKKSAINDYSEVSNQIYIPLKDLINCKNFEDLFPKTIDEKTKKEKEIKISLQLHYLLTVLKKRLNSNKMPEFGNENQSQSI